MYVADHQKRLAQKTARKYDDVKGYARMSYLYLLLGLVLLAMGGEALVRGSVRLSQLFKLSRFVIGFIVLALMTSTPELSIALKAAMRDHPDLALGTIIGSNIANILLVLAIPALIHPIRHYEPRTLRNGVIMAVLTVMVMGMLNGGEITRVMGLVLLCLLGVYLLLVWYADRSETALQGTTAHDIPNNAQQPALTPGTKRAATAARAGFSLDNTVIGPLLIIGGAAGLYFGANFMIDGLVGLAAALNVPEAVLGVSLAAVATSLPELATIIVAGLRKHAELAVGAIIGSNIINILAVLGITACVHPLTVGYSFIQIDMWMMFTASFLVIPFIATDWQLGRLEAGALLLLYAAYIVVRWSGESLYIFL